MTPEPVPMPLSYAPPIRSGGIGAASVAVGAVGFVINMAVAATMAGQLLKQWGYIPHGRSRQPMDAWLLATALASCLGVTFAALAVVMGVALLRGRRGAISFHRRYAWAKLPLSLLFAACVGWGLPFFGIVETRAIFCAIILAFVVSAGYPLLLLRSLPRTWAAAAERPHA